MRTSSCPQANTFKQSAVSNVIAITLFIFFSSLTVKQSFYILQSRKNIPRLFLAANLTLDNAVSVITMLLQHRDDLRKIDMTLSDLHLWSELSRCGRRKSVLEMQIAHIFSEGIKRIDRISIAVHYRVRRVKVDIQIVKP